MGHFKERKYYKPFEFPWAFEAFRLHEQIHWVADEVSLADDVRDWNNVLTDSEKFFLTQNFRSFTQADIDVASTYVNDYLPVFKAPEVRMMLLSIAAREAVHIHAYSHLIDTVGMPETEYRLFLEYEEVKAKHDEAMKKRDLLLQIVVRSIFGEGVQLFASFIMLLNFTRFGRMKGMGQIITWSIRDESLHVDSMAKLYNSLPEKAELEEIWIEVTKILNMEDKFIDLAFSTGAIEGITTEEMKEYIRFITGERAKQIGLSDFWSTPPKQPFSWLPGLLNGVEHANFFETRATEYSSGCMTGSWSDAY